jgi:hypothetical protein
MLFPGGSSQHPASSQNSASEEGRGLPEMADPGLLFRMALWLLRMSGQAMGSPLPVRVYYKFDSGCWRSRNTLQLHKGYRCR